MKLRIAPLDPSVHDRESFTCGHDPIDRYLRRVAAQAAKLFKSGTFILEDADDRSHIVGFYTLALHAYRDGELDQMTARALKVVGLAEIPMILLGQLAIAKDFHGRGLGKMLLWDALERSFSVATEIGGLAMITDPIDEQAANFYKRYDFQTLQEAPFPRLLLPMKTIRLAIASSVGATSPAATAPVAEP